LDPDEGAARKNVTVAVSGKYISPLAQSVPDCRFVKNKELIQLGALDCIASVSFGVSFTANVGNENKQKNKSKNRFFIMQFVLIVCNRVSKKDAVSVYTLRVELKNVCFHKGLAYPVYKLVFCENIF